MTTYNRGEVVLVRFPNSDLKTYKKRPALVIQAENVASDIGQKIVAMITSTIRNGPTRVFVEKNSEVGRKMGLLSDSYIVTDNLATIKLSLIDKVIGNFPNEDYSKIENALKKTLGMQ